MYFAPLDQVRQVALCRPLLLAVDGLASYVKAFSRAFRTSLPRRPGELGRPQLLSWPNIAIVQAVKQRRDGELTTIQELFAIKVPPSPWAPPPQRGRRSKKMLKLIDQWCNFDHD